MKNLIKNFLLILCFMIHNQALAKDGYKEYGIALILPKEYFTEAQRMNKEIAVQMPDVVNLPNVFHVTLYQGRFLDNQIKELYQELKNQNFSKIKIQLDSTIKTVEDCYINWPVKKNQELENLHKKIVEIATPYHHGILFRYSDRYNKLSKKQQKQATLYGMPELLENYNPHITLFYLSEENSEIKNIAKKISPTKLSQNSQESASIAIGEIGYNGNMVRILHRIELQ